MQNWQANGAGGLYGTYTSLGGGGMPASGARDIIDFQRMGSPGQIPEAQYPDGYIGAGNANPSRREDRLTATIRDQNQRPYTRGVHAGSRIPPTDYIWPDDQKPDRALRSAAANSRRTPVVGMEQSRLVRGGKDLPGPPTPSMPDPNRQGQLAHLRPPWS